MVPSVCESVHQVWRIIVWCRQVRYGGVNLSLNINIVWIYARDLISIGHYQYIYIRSNNIVLYSIFSTEVTMYWEASWQLLIGFSSNMKYIVA